ncbi:hypothetical protein Tco_1190256 [Tanacetum coccineum]
MMRIAPPEVREDGRIEAVKRHKSRDKLLPRYRMNWLLDSSLSFLEISQKTLLKDDTVCNSSKWKRGPSSHLILLIAIVTSGQILSKIIILVDSGKPFGSNDYMDVTPSWAVYGANEGEFDPEQARLKRERNHKTKSLID